MNKTQRTYNHFAGQNIRRIEAISDGVFAIALTLLVLDIKVPVSEAIKSESDLIGAFCSLTPKLLSYFLSFMTLGIFWTGQSFQFQYIEKSDRNLNWISLFFLLAVSILPFTTAFLSEFIAFKFAVGVYWFNILMLGVLILVNWNYAYNHGYLSFENDIEKEAINKAVKERVYVAQILYGSGALLCFINTYLSISVIILIQLNYALGVVNKIGVKKYKNGISK